MATHFADRYPTNENDAARWVALEGDNGGQIYAVIPVKCFRPDVTTEQLDALLERLDGVAWPCNRGDGASWNVVEDYGPWPADFSEWLEHRCQDIPGRVVPANMLPVPVQVDDLTVVGVEVGGSEGLILSDRVWVHYEFGSMLDAFASVCRPETIVLHGPDKLWDAVCAAEMEAFKAAEAETQC